MCGSTGFDVLVRRARAGSVRDQLGHSVLGLREAAPANTGTTNRPRRRAQHVSPPGALLLSRRRSRRRSRAAIQVHVNTSRPRPIIRYPASGGDPFRPLLSMPKRAEKGADALVVEVLNRSRRFPISARADADSGRRVPSGGSRLDYRRRAVRVTASRRCRRSRFGVMFIPISAPKMAIDDLRPQFAFEAIDPRGAVRRARAGAATIESREYHRVFDRWLPGAGSAGSIRTHLFFDEDADRRRVWADRMDVLRDVYAGAELPGMSSLNGGD